jgi:predicted RND superfamily exporter protein
VLNNRLSEQAARWLNAWGSFAVRRAGRIALVGLLVCAGAGWVASGLDLADDVAELLPSTARSVQDMRRVLSKVGGSNLTIAIQSPDLKSNERFAEDLVARLRQRMAPDIRFIDYNVRDLAAFFEQHAVLYADRHDIEQIEQELKSAIDEQKLKRNPLYIDLDDAPAPALAAPAPDRFAKIQERIDSARRENDPYPDSYFVTDDGKLMAIFVRPSRQAAPPRIFTAQIRALIEALGPTHYHPGMRVDFTGELETGLEEYESVKREIVSTAALCVLLVAAAVLFYFRRLRVLGLLGGTLIAGGTVSFAIARVLFGSINVETAFLGSIIVGTGINYGIILLGRYFEERQEGRDVERALCTALAGTLRATFIAAVATAASFGALFFGKITAFHQFGAVGGAGIFLCWVATFALLPALIVLIERLRPSRPRRLKEWRYPRFLAAIPIRLPYLVIALSVVATVLSVRAVRTFLPDSLETNLANLRNKAMDGTYTAELDHRVAEIFYRHRRSMTPVFMLSHSRDQSAHICDYFNGLVDRMGGDRAPIRRCHSVFELLPSDVPAKLAAAERVRKLMNQVADDDVPQKWRSMVADLRHKLDAKVPTLESLPEPLRRTYTTSDGELGTFVAIEPPGGRDLWVAKNLFDFTDAVRSVQIDGETLTTSGMPVVFADILRTISRDGPLTTTIAALAVILILAVGLGSWRAGAVVGASLVAGVTWMMGTAAHAGVKINFMNFVALPTTFGIAVDYAVNIRERAWRESADAEGLYRTLARTGGAVFLCSLTTIIGYYTLVVAKNMALASMGKLAMLGEFTCLASAMILLPAMLRLTQSRRVAGALQISELTRIAVANDDTSAAS